VTPGATYLIGFTVTFVNGVNVGQVGAWLQDANGFPVATSGTLSTPAQTSWTTLSGSAIYKPGAGVTSINLVVLTNVASTTVKATNTAGASAATVAWLVQL
jgi:hypothetical protein